MSWPLAPAAVALDALEPDERPLADRLLADDPTFRAEVDRLRATTATLTTLDATTWDPVPPPPLRSDTVAAPQERARLAVPAVAVLRTRRARFAVSGGLLAAAVLAVALLLARGGDGPVRDPGATTIALRPLAGVSGRASLTIAGSEAQLRGSGLPPSGAHDYYEAWLADSRGRMVSMGTFRVKPDGRLDVRMAVAVDVSAYTLVDVSLEPDDGDPGHSDRSVLRAKL
ncbi:anti-sigma factor domain-containing protein [Baekduia sp. Peel2402]|uniref:anti-sigma factor domain-containing protein n=1 Tax=Baekduia sp. Peel2402 TaxID=3458296 RepID=UPI00403E38DF